MTPKQRIQKLTHIENDCHIWLGGTKVTGEPRMNIKQRYYQVNRINFLIDKGFEMDRIIDTEYKSLKRIYNTCGNRLCINPKHFNMVSEFRNLFNNVCRICKEKIESNYSTSTPKPAALTQSETP